MLSRCLRALLLSTLSISAPSLGQVPIGTEFQVNTTTLSYQYHPDVAMAGDGRCIVVWQAQTNVLGQLYDGSGAPVGEEFQVNSYTSFSQSRPTVTMADGGSFIVAWHGDGLSGPGIQMRQFESDGTPVGEDFQVNTYDIYVSYAQIDEATSGEFVVAWRGAYDQPNTTGIQSQRFDAYGAIDGAQIWINPNTPFGFWPRVARSDSGSFLVVWSENGVGDLADALGQLVAGDGSRIGDEFQINAHTTGVQQRPDVATLPNGGFVVAHQDRDRDLLVVQRLDDSANPIGSEQVIADPSTLAYPSIAVGQAGEFIVVWNSRYSVGSDNSGWSVQAQLLSPNLDLLGAQFQVNTYEFNDQRNPRVSTSTEGDFVVAWMSRGSGGTDTSDWSIQGQRYISALVFTDGFESGDTSTWSNAVP